MQDLTPRGRVLVEDLARRHAVDADAVATLLRALVAGGGAMAQFSHPALGGMGQWSQGGMIMVGDMFNHGLKAKVDALCRDLAAALRGEAPLVVASAAGQMAAGQMQHQGGAWGGAWWPAELGVPASVGTQNDTAYAYFPGTRRLAVRQQGRVSVYDTLDHRIGGFSQQQAGFGSFGFLSQHGSVPVDSLPLVSEGAKPMPAASAPAASPPSAAEPPRPASATPGGGGDGDLLATLERLAQLKDKGVLTEAEFAAKKAEILSRL